MRNGSWFLHRLPLILLIHNALNDIGTALYELRRHIEALENEHRLEDLRQRKAD